MIELGQAAKTTVATLGMMAIHGTLLALGAVVLARIWRTRPAWQAAIWLVVLVKFVLPWGPAMPWSLADLIASLQDAPPPIVLSSTFTPVALPETQASIAPAIGWLLLAASWAAGTAYVLARAIRSHVVAVQRARRANAAPPAVVALLEELSAKMRVRPPQLVVGDAATGPYVIGSFSPIVVVPPALLDDDALLRAALLHELAHIRRRDAIGRMIQIVAVALFWWLPVVRLASRALELARERACDAWALESCEVSRPAYARLLVRMSQLHAAPAGSSPLVSSVSSLASPRTLDTRVTSVLGPQARARLSVWHRFALAGWIILALGGARTAEATVVGQVCQYTPELAVAILQAYPAADSDGDGTLSRDEACDYQAELRRLVAEQPETTIMLSGPTSELLGEPLCCNCGEGEGLSSTSSVTPNPYDSATCKAEGVDR